MAKIVLITGGARSGKSDYAEQYAGESTGDWSYLATCPPAVDQEMAVRIAAHREHRRDKGWQSIEEEINVADAIKDIAAGRNVLIDCLTMWVSNLLLQADGQFSEADMMAECRRLLAVCRQRAGIYIMVSGEVGGGIVPDNRLARRYRDLVGRCNQLIAAEADEVFLVSCGIAVRLK